MHKIVFVWFVMNFKLLLSVHVSQDFNRASVKMVVAVPIPVTLLSVFVYWATTEHCVNLVSMILFNIVVLWHFLTFLCNVLQ